METKKLTDVQIALLKKPLPPEAISKHPTKTFLSSIKPIYVVERLNDVFGIGSYQFDNREITKEGKMVVVESILTIPEYGIRLSCYGGNDNTDLGDAYKGAATDALTKIASYLAIGMDVFKGLGDSPKTNNTATIQVQVKQEQPKVTEWLTEDQFNTTMKSDKKAILAVLSLYNGQKGKGMKSDYLTKLTAQLSLAK
jgi:hypothetical protein